MGDLLARLGAALDRVDRSLLAGCDKLVFKLHDHEIKRGTLVAIPLVISIAFHGLGMGHTAIYEWPSMVPLFFISMAVGARTSSELRTRKWTPQARNALQFIVRGSSRWASARITLLLFAVWRMVSMAHFLQFPTVFMPWIATTFALVYVYMTMTFVPEQPPRRKEKKVAVSSKLVYT